MELKDFRRQYTKGGLRRGALPEQPMALFEQWQADATAAGLADPTGCVVATVHPGGMVRQRFVLLKGVDERGFVFYTNYKSDKAVALSNCDEARDRRRSLDAQALCVSGGRPKLCSLVTCGRVAHAVCAQTGCAEAGDACGQARGEYPTVRPPAPSRGPATGCSHSDEARPDWTPLALRVHSF